MITQLAKPFKEKSSGTITANFTDKNGVKFTPLTLAWSLTDTKGTTINSRSSVSLSPTSSSVEIELDGDDLQIQSCEPKVVKRILTLQGTYSDAGTTKNIKDSVWFSIENLVAVT